MKNICDITLYDLMAEDFDVYVSRNCHDGFDIEIDNEHGEPVVQECGLNFAAMDSFADLCRNFLHFYNQAKEQEKVA